MESVEFYVSGSAPEPYLVTFVKRGTELNAYCTCPAGQNGQYCKHRFRILAGDSRGIVTGDTGDVDLVQKWLPGSSLELAFAAMENAQAAYEDAKKILGSAKKAVARAMRT